jgi:hypothetical protein
MSREGLDEPFGPPPMEYPYRCTVCGTEVLVNEAIIDAGIGMAKFRNEYQELMVRSNVSEFGKMC